MLLLLLTGLYVQSLVIILQKRKDKDQNRWILLGFLFGIIALVVIGLTKPEEA